MAQDRPRGAALATSAIGSFIAGTIGTTLSVVTPRARGPGVSLGSPEYFALILVAFAAIGLGPRRSRARGFRPCSSASRSASSASIFVTGQQRLYVRDAALLAEHRRRRHRGRDFSPSGRLSGWRRPAAQGGDGDPVGPTVALPRGLARSWKPWLRGPPWGSRSGRSRRGRRDPDVSLVPHGAAALEAPGGVRQGRHRGGRRPGGREQRAACGNDRAAPHARASDLVDRGDHAGGSDAATGFEPGPL